MGIKNGKLFLKINPIGMLDFFHMHASRYWITGGSDNLICTTCTYLTFLTK